MGSSDHEAIAPTLAAAPATPATAPTLAATPATPATAPTLAATPSPGAAAAGASAPAPADAPRYALGAVIGKGGMGEVRAAHDDRVGRQVAIKALAAGDAPPPAAVARFLREARVQGRLDHPAIVPVHDLGFDARGVPYFVMKKLAGVTLADVLARQAAGDAEALARWPRRALLTRLVDLAQAVAFAHTRGVIHRDLKPHNVMLGDFGEVYVLDWGIAKLDDDDDDALPAGGRIERGDLDTLDSVVGETAAGAVLGTPGYMAPEQARGGAIDHRVDVYALGCLLFEVLALEPLQRRGGGLAAALDAAAGHPAARRPDLDIPPELDALCAAATAPDRAARLASVRALIDGLQRYLDGDRDVARRRELARVHAEAARAAVAAGDRTAAMREAGRALALDPAHDEAARLISQLLLEPPAEPPPEVEAALAAERIAASRPYLRVGAIGYLAYLGLIPAMVVWAGIKDWTMPAVISGLALLNAWFAWWLSRHPADPGRLEGLALIVDGALVGLTATLFSPLLLTPALATATVVAFLSMPARRDAARVLLTAGIVMLAPLLLEAAGVLPTTVTIADGAIVIRSWVLELDGPGVYVLLVGSNLSVTAVLASMVTRLRRSQEEATRAQLLLTWHLRALAPAPATGTGPAIADATPAPATAPPTAAR